MKPLFAMGALAVLLALLACGLMGCGAGSSNSSSVTGGSSRGTGNAHIIINWPTVSKLTGAHSRFIPINTQSVRITVFGSIAGTTTPNVWAIVYVDKPSTGGTSTATIDYLPVGSLNVTVDAFSVNSATIKAGGTPPPTVIATGTTSTTIIVDQTVQLPITLGSTINNIQITPANSTITLTDANPVNQQLIATAYDASGAMVPIPPGEIAWTVNTVTQTTNADGSTTFVAQTIGIYTIAAIDLGSKATGSTTLTVKGTINILPAAPAPINLNATQKFTAAIFGTTNLRVNWVIVDSLGNPITDGSAGTLKVTNNDGINPSSVTYTPKLPGTYTIQATPQAFPDQSATVSIQVLGGYGQITITNG